MGTTLHFRRSRDVRDRVALLSATAALSLAACSGGSGSPASPAVASSSSETLPSPSVAAQDTPFASPSPTPEADASAVVGTVVRFSAGSTAVELTIDKDNPAVRDFLAMLPLTLTLDQCEAKRPRRT